jgi:hypothetical protein
MSCISLVRSARFSPLAALLLLVTAQCSQAQVYTTVFVPASPFGPFIPRGINGDQVVGYSVGEQHALTWDAGTGAFANLDPAGYYFVSAHAVSNSRVVGGGVSETNDRFRPLLWPSANGPVIDLLPVGYEGAIAVGVDGNDIAGTAQRPGQYGHAMVWHGNANDYVDLHPAGYIDTSAVAVSAGQVVGRGDTEPAMNSEEHALLWTGTAGSVVDLTPPGRHWAYATDVSNGEQVGVSGPDAVVWHGTAESAVFLTPTGYYMSAAAGTNGRQQVGSGGFDYDPDIDFPRTFHALVWAGSADSYIDLHSFLPAGFDNSYATGIDLVGNIVGYAAGPLGSQTVIWRIQSTPEPGMLLMPLGVATFWAYVVSRRLRRTGGTVRAL